MLTRKTNCICFDIVCSYSKGTKIEINITLYMTPIELKEKPTNGHVKGKILFQKNVQNTSLYNWPTTLKERKSRTEKGYFLKFGLIY